MLKNLLATILTVGGLAAGAAFPEHSVVKSSKPANALGFDGRWLGLAGRGLFQLYDTAADPRNPQLAGEVKGLPMGENRQMVFHGHYVYLTARSRGLWVIDIADPANPRICGNFDTLELATGIDVSGDALFITLRDYGIEVFDISDPEKPVHRAHFLTFEAQSAWCDNGRLAVGNWGCSTLQFFDVSDPANAKSCSSVKLDGFGDGVCIVGNTAYAATGHHSSTGTREQRHGAGHGLEIFDISDIHAPKKLGSVKFDRFWALGNDFWFVFVSGKYACVADTHNGVRIVDVSDPARPKIAYSMKLPEQKYGADTRPECVTGIAPGKGVVYFSGDRTGLHVATVPGLEPMAPRKGGLKFTAPAEPFRELPGFRRIECGGMARRIFAADDRLFAACSDAGLRCFDAQGKLLAAWPNRIAFDVVADGDTVYTIESTNLNQYRLTRDLKLEKRSSQFLPGSSTFLRFLPGKQYLLTYGGGGRINCFKLSGDQPTPVSNYTIKRILYSDDISENFRGNLFAVNAFGDGTHLVKCEEGKLTAATAPVKTNSAHLNGPLFLGDRIFLGNGENGYLLIDAAEPWSIQEVKTEQPVGGIPTLDGKRMTLTDRRNGKVTIAEVKDPEHITVKRTLDLLPATADKALFFHGKIVIPAGYAGIYWEK